LAPYRLPITLVCIGIDNLQYINDAFGHATGDDLIQVVAHTVRPMLRPSDFISRLGGAEFALLLPETTDENAANIVAKVHDQLQQVMKKNGWPVTLSIGVVSCKDSSCTVNKLVSAAEALVKVAKNSGGNTVKFKIMDLSPVAPEQPDGASK